jgi:hypothetical protein
MPKPKTNQPAWLAPLRTFVTINENGTRRGGDAKRSCMERV